MVLGHSWVQETLWGGQRVWSGMETTGFTSETQPFWITGRRADLKFRGSLITPAYVVFGLIQDTGEFPSALEYAKVDTSLLSS